MHLVGFVVAGQRVHDKVDAEAVGHLALPLAAGHRGEHRPADVVDGRLKAVPHAIFAAAVVVRGGRSGLDVPHEELGRIRGHLKRYYDKMDDVPPWE